MAEKYWYLKQGMVHARARHNPYNLMSVNTDMSAWECELASELIKLDKRLARIEKLLRGKKMKKRNRK